MSGIEQRSEGQIPDRVERIENHGKLVAEILRDPRFAHPRKSQDQHITGSTSPATEPNKSYAQWLREIKE